jgi:hypothetical protein
LVTLKPGEEFSIPSGSSYQINSGVYYRDYVNTDLPTLLHAEVARRAASILSGTVENYDRVTDIDRRVETDTQPLQRQR